MKLWVDDIRPAPKGYRWCKSVNTTKSVIRTYEFLYWHTRNDYEFDNFFNDVIAKMQQMKREGE